MLDGEVEGDAQVIVDRPARIEDATPGTLSFLANPKYEEYAYECKASILLVNQTFRPNRPIAATLIRVADVYAAMAILAERFDLNQAKEAHIASNAVIDPSTKIGKNVSIADFVVIGPDCEIEDGVSLHPFVFLGSNCKIGRGTNLHSGVKVHYGTQIGAGVTIQANTVLGSDGFGYVKTEGEFKKIKQLGNVVIEDNVEIGANVVVDRASLGSTVIREGAKLDNLIQIAQDRKSVV